MRLNNPLVHRLSALEAALKPAGRCFCLVIDETDDRDARAAAFKAENGVKPHDKLLVVIITEEERPCHA